jgi:hypothetical protein
MIIEFLFQRFKKYIMFGMFPLYLASHITFEMLITDSDT